MRVRAVIRESALAVNEIFTDSVGCELIVIGWCGCSLVIRSIVGSIVGARVGLHVVLRVHFNLIYHKSN